MIRRQYNVSPLTARHYRTRVERGGVWTADTLWSPRWPQRASGTDPTQTIPRQTIPRPRNGTTGPSPLGRTGQRTRRTARTRRTKRTARTRETKRTDRTRRIRQSVPHALDPALLPTRPPNFRAGYYPDTPRRPTARRRTTQQPHESPRGRVRPPVKDVISTTADYIRVHSGAARHG